MNINFFNLHPKKKYKRKFITCLVWILPKRNVIACSWLYGFYNNNDNIDIYGGMIKKNNVTPDFKEFKIPKTFFGLSL